MSGNHKKSSVMPEGSAPSLQGNMEKKEIAYLHNLSIIRIPTQSTPEILSPLSKTKNEQTYQQILEKLRKEFHERMSKGSTLSPIAEMQKFHALKTLGFGSFGTVFLNIR